MYTLKVYAYQLSYLFMYSQRQYKFIHHALSELVVCGETEVTAFDLRTYTDALNEQPDDSGITIARKHYQVTAMLMP